MGKREKERVFRMKRFNVRHSASANKVGVDGVLVGAWSDVSGAGRILDAGSGCGLMALMVAQRAPNAFIHAVEIDPEAVEEARQNVAQSPWKDRIRVEEADFSLLPDRVSKGEGYDLIVSNPPFFHAGVEAARDESCRTLARHAGSLSPEALIRTAPAMLNPDGRLSFIAQAESEDMLLLLANTNGLALVRLCRVKGNPAAPVKRVLMEFRVDSRDSKDLNDPNDPKDLNDLKVPKDFKDLRDLAEELVIESAPNVFTPEYTELCRPFYVRIPD